MAEHTTETAHITFSTPERDADEPMAAVVYAEVDGQRIGHLAWFDCDDHPEYEENTVAYLHVEKGWRRRGVATALWLHVQSINPDVQHSPTLTDDAEAWVAALRCEPFARRGDIPWVSTPPRTFAR